MSDQISITGIHAFGFHGVYDHERRDGQDFFVDVLIDLSLAKASQSDALKDTVDYGRICDIVIEEIAGPPCALIEKLAGNIGDQLLKTFKPIKKIKVTVHKPAAPVDAQVLDIAVAVERSR
ncbi:unannotated protein [freshwater metagenome]|uniref:dihydroneopterin aldolase n=1 Tax=freshwater metagenome TaxID=449393 RepID=A0A6J6ETS2_9ZZZZ|nr:dihydroneopterin aldolase [Actinomycetota bacterium]MSZ85903.1 dihydroneopterin aldolase [Actinomycetota bacterium]MTA36243.1 dihydroneopterin aldolase [Actinomycetota bacterium]